MIPNWQPTGTAAMGGEHIAAFADHEMGVEMAVVTPVNRASGKFGKARMRYAIRGVRKVFLTQDDMLDEWERRQKPGGIRIDDCCPECGADIAQPASPS